MRLLWLPEVLRAAGLTVHEVGGWRTRGRDVDFQPRGIMCHETRGSLHSTDAGEIGVLLNGSQTAPPPIAQLYLSRTGHWHVVASGRCNHVLTGWAGPFKGIGNTGLLGIEAQHALGEPWTDRQYDSYVRGVAAIRKRTGWGIGGHKEHQPGGYGHSSTKTDPSFNMDQFRRDVAARLAGEDEEMALSDRDAERLIWRVDALVAGRPTVIGGPSVGERVIANERIIALAAAVARLPGAESLRAELDQLDQAVAAARTEIAGVDEAVLEGLAGMDVVDLAGVLRRGLSADQVAALAAALATPAS